MEVEKLKNKFKIMFVSILLLAIIAGLWYSSSYGSISKKREMKQVIKDNYESEVQFKSIEYIESGPRSVGEDWVVTYLVKSEDKCIKYRSWFKPKDLTLDTTVKEGSCT